MKEKGSGNRLIALSELLFMPMAFYVLTQWEKIGTWQGKVLWFMVFALVQNEFLTVRNSYRFYSAWLYLLDLLSLVVYVIGLVALTKTNRVLGYDPIFWIYLSILWFGYAIWDFLMSSNEPNFKVKEKLIQWGRLMLLFAFVTLACGFALLNTFNKQVSQGNIMIYVLQVVPVSFVIYALMWWVRDLKTVLGTKPNEESDVV